MKLEALSKDRINGFKEFCIKHRKEVDESFLDDRELEDFNINAENPTYLILDEKESIVAAASLIINDYNRRGKKARFRIFYSEVASIDYYMALLKEMLKYVEGLSKLFLYVKTDNNILMKIFHDLDFIIERYSYVLERDHENLPEVELPGEYSIKNFVKGQDEETWRDIRNIAFAKLQGSETPITKEAVERMLEESDYIVDGMKILYHGDQAVGIVKGNDDIEEGEPVIFIGPVAILPEYQGKGLGRSLLREIMNFGKAIGYKKSMLSVNAENENANKLYISEGFTQLEAVACYIYKL